MKAHSQETSESFIVFLLTYLNILSTEILITFSLLLFHVEYDSAMANGSPPKPQCLRIGRQSFLPLSEDVVTTRGQRLPSIIRDRSTTSIRDLRAQLGQRRQSTFIKKHDDEQDVEREGDRQSSDRGGEEPREMQRRTSNASQVLLTPQMRSMRLIGKNNPRYEW